MDRERFGQLHRCSDLRVLPERTLERLARQGHRLDKARGELIWRCRDRVNEVFVLLEGTAHVQMSGPEGELVLTGLVLPGHLIGEAEIFAGERHRFNQVMAAERCRLMVLPATDFSNLVDEYPEYARYWLNQSSHKFITSLRHIYSLKVGSAPARLARTLLLIHQWQSAAGHDDMALSQETIGQYAGLSRQVVNGILSEWRRQGLISTGYGRLRLEDPGALGRIAES